MSLTATTDAAPAPDANAHIVELIVPDAHCAGCIARIERGLARVPGMGEARLNLTSRRLRLRLDGAVTAADAVAAVEALGYRCRPFDAAGTGMEAEDREGRKLLWALAVAGFAAGNVMLLSVSVWSGADGATRDLFHWISALIALPAIAYAGQPFFGSAWRALRAGGLNMDVPISLAVILAGLLSLHAVAQGGDEAFFDAAVMLLFFLLMGRYLDHRVRARARAAASRLLSLRAEEATRLVDGRPVRVPVADIMPGDRVLVAAGERFPVDGELLSAAGDIDRAVVTGESGPVAVRSGDSIQTGVMNLGAPLTMRVTAVGADTWLAQVVRLMEKAESGRGRYLRLADRAARIYAPLVHLAAALTFLGWMLAGVAWGEALWIAVSVLIITCPCALGLAAPAVQVVAGGVLFRAGILVKDGAALERLAEADRAVFDKTGTLTTGRLELTAADWPDHLLAPAAALAGHSRHPLARALTAHAHAAHAADVTDAAPVEVTAVAEHPGQGLAGVFQDRPIRLGNRSFCGVDAATATAAAAAAEGPEVWLAIDGRPVGRACFADTLRPGAGAVIAELGARGFSPLLLSGDHEEAVRRAAAAAGFRDWRAGLRPEDKIAALEALKRDGHKPLMVGDGVNDGPALAAAHVSMAPAAASDVGRAAADLVFTGEGLAAVALAWRAARDARALILQNFALAGLYNLVAVPVAVMGGASPLVAALAMSGSSIVVTLNALRLRVRRFGGAEEAAVAAAAPGAERRAAGELAA